jgi:hypothetical protein
MPETGTGDNRGSWLRTAIFAAVLGVPAFLLLVVITSGVVLIPVAALAVLAPVALVHYLLWGWALPRARPEEGAAGKTADTSGDPVGPDETAPN